MGRSALPHGLFFPSFPYMGNDSPPFVGREGDCAVLAPLDVKGDDAGAAGHGGAVRVVNVVDIVETVVRAEEDVAVS